MNYSTVLIHLKKCGYKVSALNSSSFANEFFTNEFFTVDLEINNYAVTLLHITVTELSQMPSFLLTNPSNLPRLAHTTLLLEIPYASICVNTPDSVSVNYECPELAFEDSLKRHVSLLKQALSDSEWNKSELLREFEAGWLNIVNPKIPSFLCLSESRTAKKLSVFKPRTKNPMGFGSYFLGYAEGCISENTFSPINQIIKDREATKGHGFVIPLSVTTPAPCKKDDISEWYLNLLNNLPLATKTKLIQEFSQQRSREFWLVFNAQIPSGTTWFGIYFSLKNSVKGRKNLPFKNNHLVKWDLEPIDVLTFNKERLMPRSGAEQSLLGKKVMLVGCGSVGGDIADKLAASGIGHITLCDPDTLSLNNLYRHILPPLYVSAPKASALLYSLSSKYPWIEIDDYSSKLLDLRNSNVLSQYDLIILAIGSPTQERIFHDYLLTERIQTPVINTWVEGYGIGGHAVLDIPGKKGCLRCAYVDASDYSRGLASNLNFFAPNQNLTKNHAGCGDAFLPYTYIASSQTALIAVNLAVKYLLNKLSNSCKISWKGSSEDAISNGFKLSERYNAFNRSLEILPLYNNECDICNGKF
ncbi:ThiF family adenylyltransferase [Stenoxybacter acetivorans]|uniref:ThiF family adenylyltransferase n=1 Tax=Stenoxybacter acetivorans TaxID=422441 RepID=UPI0005626A5F|nr:ThiF family adenylyltransferase [Stenoxybacter acetivorans]